MNLSGKKLTTAILAGLMGATVAGISVVGAANQTKVDNAKVDTALHVDRDGTLLVGTDKNKPVNHYVSVKKGFKDGTTEAGQGNIVSAKQTVGKNLTALDTAIAANKQETDKALENKADKAALEKAKVDTALHVDTDGTLLVGTDKKSIRLSV